MQVDVGGHALEVKHGGEGPGAFVALHGLADTLEVWRHLEPVFGRRGRWFLLDQRGHGRSGTPPGPCRREDLARDVRALLDALELPKAVLVGHSMGGIVAMTTALLFPERVSGLVLLGTTGRCNRRAADWYEAIAEAGARDGLDGLRRAIFGPKARREIVGDPSGIAEVTRCLRSLLDDPLTPKLAALPQPAMLLVGSRDPMGPAASAMLFRSLPNATLEVVPGRGHWLHVEAPDVVARALERFLRLHGESLGFDDPARV